ncbi:MAG: alpha/beta hydrolase [Chloroflexi bacterium AL-W]|nr:alpha/beta hydrolase [Chloroflexi bacterium AL-N1]NOK64908.1 alpha/beta hydrolase [Chloroflexi bacterium AL-N10]NOK76678.1 alpha/beta hydrolase [Chloroflexi bacterium AL-N5]NOK84569.1 alpha/beta hydrolase [Chloroflexi bacterium AL-W]NOK86606.1 alpha/beta hydrolase [Chloroflexi bacterium AL-N15]
MSLYGDFNLSLLFLKEIIQNMSQHIAKTVKGPIEYRLEGNGPTVIVLNGGHCSRDSRFSHERLVDHGFAVLTPSRPGYDATPPELGRTAQDAADSLVALLDTLHISVADVIGISAAGPTALAFAQRHPDKLRKLILEAAMATPWDEGLKKRARLLFGRFERATWRMTKLMLKLAPKPMVRMMLQELTILDIDQVLQRMSQEDMRFIQRMIETSQSGTGFMNDIEHVVDNLEEIITPTLVLYSPNDKTVLPKNAMRVAAEVTTAELYEVPSDTHLIWIGPSAKDVWQKRLLFLNA